MIQKLAAVALALAALGFAACGGHSSSSGGNVLPTTQSFTLPSIDSDLTMTAILPAHTIGEELPSEGLGTVNAVFWKAVVGGFTQTQYSQTLGFPPGTKITIRNLSKTLPHTLNVIKTIAGPPAAFPTSPTLLTTAHGNGMLEAGYRSGVINPGKSVTVTLVKAGNYLIGCAYHYSQGMRDVLVVKTGAHPGMQATPPPAGTKTPTPSPSGPGGGY